MTATRVTAGAISLSSSAISPLMPYSNGVNPVALPPGRARLSTKPAPTGSATLHEHDRHVRVACCNAAVAGRTDGQDHVRRKRDQFASVSAVALASPAPQR